MEMEEKSAEIIQDNQNHHDSNLIPPIAASPATPYTESSYSELDSFVASLGKDLKPLRNTTPNGRINIDGILEDILQDTSSSPRKKVIPVEKKENGDHGEKEVEKVREEIASPVFSLDESIDDSNTPKVLSPLPPRSDESKEVSAKKEEKLEEKNGIAEKKEVKEEAKGEEQKRSQPEKSVSFSSEVPSTLHSTTSEEIKPRSNRTSFSTAFSLGKSKSFEGGALKKKNKLKNSTSGENEEVETKEEKRRSIFTFRGGKKELKRQSSITAEPNEEIPLSDDDLDELVVTMLNPSEGLKLSKHKGVESFSGAKMANWIRETLHITQPAALNVAQNGFFDRGVIEPLSSKVNSFQDKSDVYYKFKIQDMKDVVLNLGKLHKETVKDPVELSKKLIEKAISILIASKNPEGKVSFGSTFGSPDYNRLALLSSQLQRVDLNSMSDVDRSTFYVNVFNTLSLHARFISGEPTNNFERKELLQRKYMIGSQDLSLADLMDCIRGVPTAKGPNGIKEPMLRCLLFDGTDRSPRITPVEPSQLSKEQLKGKIVDYLSKNVTINSAEGEVWLPKYFKDVTSDFQEPRDFSSNLAEFMNSSYLKTYGPQVDVRFFDNSHDNVQYLP